MRRVAAGTGRLVHADRWSPGCEPAGQRIRQVRTPVPLGRTAPLDGEATCRDQHQAEPASQGEGPARVTLAGTVPAGTVRAACWPFTSPLITLLAPAYTSTVSPATTWRYLQLPPAR